MSKRQLVECFLVGMTVNVLAGLCGVSLLVTYLMNAAVGAALGIAFYEEDAT
jgi:hypothetical protein